MLILLASRIDRSRMLLVNARLDGYPAFFHIAPEALADYLALAPGTDFSAALASNWPRLAPTLEKLVRRFGNDFIVTAELLGH